MECFFGALYGGFPLTPINLVAGSDAIAYALDHAEARVPLVDEPRFRIWKEVAPVGSTALRAETAIESPTRRPGLLPELVAADDALLMRTSGTTGHSKGVVHTQASLLAGGWKTAVAHALASEDRALCTLPIFHVNGLCVTVIASLLSVAAVAMAPGFLRVNSGLSARNWKPSGFPPCQPLSRLSSMDGTHWKRGPGTGFASPVQRPLRRCRTFRPLSGDLFGIPIVETMGLTETAAQILSNPLPPRKRKVGSPGIAVRNETAILSRDLRALSPGQEGEIVVRARM